MNSIENILRELMEMPVEKLFKKPLLQFNSKLVKSAYYIDWLQTALNNPKKVELLYRASQHAFKVKPFHNKCDNIPNTLTLIRTEFDKTFGGFTNLS